ncbi:RHS repeat-associated core domain-containing protein [Streptomyces sp. G3]|uniref:RHS repeat-associated core domain-containing protein n=1 Tax=Streptomyces sp. G3 TaxID=690144 RepID=UPI0035AB72B1
MPGASTPDSSANRRTRRRHRQADAHLRLRPDGHAPRYHHRGRPQPFRYEGAYADPTGLYKMGHRYYDPALGRFTLHGPGRRDGHCRSTRTSAIGVSFNQAEGMAARVSS